MSGGICNTLTQINGVNFLNTLVETYKVNCSKETEMREKKKNLLEFEVANVYRGR